MQNAITQLASNSTGITVDQVKSVILSYGTKYFLSRVSNDTAEGNITFVQNVSVEKELTVHETLTAKKDVISNKFGNSTFTSGQFGSGFRMWQNPNNGQSYGEIDNLMVRRETIFNKLTIADVKSVGGQIIVSLANMLCSDVVIQLDGFVCYFDTADGTILNQFALNDQVICRTFNGQNTKYYWRRVTAIGSDYIKVSKTDADGSAVPTKGDEMIQFGNRIDPARQSAIMISAYGFDAPSFKQYAGINSYDLTGKEVTAITPSGNKFTGTFEVKSGNQSVRVPADRGTWNNGMVCYYYDRVSFLGALWLCIVPEGQTTTETPSLNSVYWQKQVAEGKALRVEKFATPSYEFYRPNVLYNTTLTSITNLVTKTGINSVGLGETLYSKINQTASQITLEVTNAKTAVKEEVKTSLTLANNGISLLGKTINLNGTTIAKAIEAEDLKVGSRTGLSALEVTKAGVLYAKGSTADGSSLIIDSQAKSIEIVATKTNLGEGGVTYGKTTTKISSDLGNVEVRNGNSVSMMGAEGVFANKAGQTMNAAYSSMANAKAAVVGLGFGSGALDSYYPDYNAVIGVAGRASNSAGISAAPAYGGYFENLKATGFILNTRVVQGGSTYLTWADNLVVGYSSSTVYLPTDYTVGRIVFLRAWAGTINVYPPSGFLIYDDSTVNTNIEVAEGNTAFCCFIKPYVNGVLKNVWLINKFKGW